MSCCQPLHQHQQTATTARQLMQSRYCAYHLMAIDYLVETTSPLQRHLHPQEDIRQWAEACQWLKLEIRDDEPGEDVSWVEFVAWYKHQGKLAVHHERSKFVRIDDRWYFDHGQYPQQAVSLPGRNDPCFCGSGKKFKRCCGR